MKKFRETLAEILYAMTDEEIPSAGAIKRLNQHVQEAQTARRFRWGESRLEMSWAAREGDARLPVWLLAQAAFELLTGDEAEKIRACANEECRWLFLDTSRNGSRRWCDMTICGNRMKARRFKAVHKA